MFIRKMINKFEAEKNEFLTDTGTCVNLIIEKDPFFHSRSKWAGFKIVEKIAELDNMWEPAEDNAESQKNLAAELRK